MQYTLYTGDNRDILKTIPDNSIDSIVTDPPYELGFMGKHWDNTGIAYNVAVWNECLRVLKPGGHLIAFGGSRTYHRLAVAIENAGFDIRDQIQWIYGSGFPKSHNLKNDWHGWGTALKPAHEPAVLARKPLTGTVADNVTAWSVGALNIDGCRVDSSDAQWTRHGTADSGMWSGKKRIYQENPTAGRWPANVLFDEEAAQVLDEQINGASRFFYVAKASKAEREAGLDGVKRVQVDASRKLGNPGGDNPRNRGVHERANNHPTVKPVELMRYLIRLVTPKGGTVLDPFMGSGSTGCAAMLEANQFIGIDITPEYVEIARRRIIHYANLNPMGL